MPDNAFAIGPGAGPYNVVGMNCEVRVNITMHHTQMFSSQMMCNCFLSPTGDRAQTYVAKLNNNNEPLLQTTNSSEFALMANLQITDGVGGGPVLHIKAAHRIGKMNF